MGGGGAGDQNPPPHRGRDLRVVVQQHKVAVLVRFQPSLVRQADEIGGVLGEQGDELFQGVGGKGFQVAQGQVHGQGAARAAAAVGQLRVAVDYHHVVDAQLVVAVGQARGLDAVGDGNHTVQTLAAQKHLYRAGVQVAAVADGLAVNVGAGQHRTHDGGLMLVEQPHAVEGVGAGFGAVGDGLLRRAVVRPGMPDGNGEFPGELPHDVLDALHLGGNGHVTDGSARLLLAAAHPGGVPLAQQGFRHGPLVVRGQERPFQMDAQHLRAAGGLLHGLGNAGDGQGGLFLRVGEDAGQEAGGAVAGKKGRQGADVLRRGRVHVHIAAAVGVHVQKSRQAFFALGIQHRHIGAQVGGDGLDLAVADEKVGRFKPMIPVHLCVFEQ